MNLALMLLVVVGGVGINALPDGAYDNATVCEQMLPLGHIARGAAPEQPFPSPYKITANATQYEPNQVITVTLSGLCETEFRGFLMEVRSPDPSTSTAYGTFSSVDSNSQPMCADDTGITHTSNMNKNEVQVRWTAPSANMGHIVFVATIVQTFSKYYVLQKSVVIRDGSIQESVPSFNGVPTPTININDCPTKPPPSVAGSRFTKPSECGQSQGCFSDCDSSGCSYLVSWINHENHVMFAIKANFLLPGGEGYMALGFSDDQRMGDDGITECVFQNTMRVFNSRNTGRQNKRSTEATASLVTGKYIDGVFSCEFELLKAETPEDTLFSLKRKRYLLLARGTSFTESNLAQHDNIPVRAKEMIDLMSNADVGGSQVSLTFVKVHGSLMVIAWIFSASIGVIVARHFKTQWQGQTCGGEKVWFQLHRGFMVLVFLAAVVAFVIIFVHVKGWSDLGHQVSKKAHPILGVIVTVLCVLNPIMAIFRPHPNEPNRPLFNWAHFTVGSVAHVLAVITVFLGVNIGQPKIPEYATWILVGYVCWQVLVELLLVLFTCISNSGKLRQTEFEMSQHGYPAQFRPAPEERSAARQSVLMTHIIVITCVTVAIIFIIVMAN